MPTKQLELQTPTAEIRKGGAIVGLTDHVYSIVGGEVVFEDVLVRGDLSGQLEYNGQRIEIVQVDAIIGLEVGLGGARGPVWKRVQCRVLE